MPQIVAVAGPHEGCVAVIDALGFKGIWNRHSFAAVLTSLATIVRDTERGTEAFGIGLSRPPFSGRYTSKPWVQAFSDTILIGCGTSVAPGLSAEDTAAAERQKDVFATSAVFVLVGMALGIAACQQTPLLYRGVVSFGKLVIHDRFIIGPAIDEAAQLMDQAQGAFVWCAPSAKQIVDRQHSSEDSYPLVRDYLVPLKGGEKLKTHAVNPLVAVPGDLSMAVNVLLRTFSGDDINIEIKKQHTAAFFQVARSFAQESHWRTDYLRKLDESSATR